MVNKAMINQSLFQGGGNKGGAVIAREPAGRGKCARADPPRQLALQ
jgi:hypothetical protein